MWDYLSRTYAPMHSAEACKNWQIENETASIDVFGPQGCLVDGIPED